MNQPTFVYSNQGFDFPIWLFWDRYFLTLEKVDELININRKDFSRMIDDLKKINEVQGMANFVCVDGVDYLDFVGFLAIVHMITFERVIHKKYYRGFNYDMWLQFNNQNALQNCRRDLDTSVIKNWDTETLLSHQFN